MTPPSPPPSPPPRAARALTTYAAALARRDWDGVRATLADDLRVTLLHTGETFGADGFVAFNRAYPGAWELRTAEVVDGGERAVLRSTTTIEGQAWHAASFATANASGRLVDLTEVWAGPVPPDTDPPTRPRPTPSTRPEEHP